MPRAKTILLVLCLAVTVAGCSKCGNFFGMPNACHDEAPAAR